MVQTPNLGTDAKQGGQDASTPKSYDPPALIDGRKVREIRTRLGLSQAELASKAGLPYPNYISRIETGKHVSTCAHKRIHETCDLLNGREARRLKWDYRQNLAGQLPTSPATGRYLKAMEDRIWSLFDQGRFKDADILLEFLPDVLATTLLDEYFWDDE